MHDRDLGLGLGRDRLLGGISVSAEIAKISAETEINEKSNFKAIFDQKSITKNDQKKYDIFFKIKNYILIAIEKAVKSFYVLQNQILMQGCVIVYL